jgi:O-antigen/teichoic acid export membrane protein
MIIKFLGIQEFGEVTFLTLPVLSVVGITSFGLVESNAIVVARYGFKPAQVKFIMKRHLVYTLATIFGLITYYILLSIRTTTISLREVIFFPTSLIFLHASNLLRSYAIGLGKWDLITLEKLITSLSRLIIIGTLGISGSLNVFISAVSIVLLPCAGSIVYLKFTPWRLILNKVDGRERLQVLQFKMSRQVFLGSALGIVLSRLDVILVASQVNRSELGQYAFAISSIEVISVVMFSLRDIYLKDQGDNRNFEKYSQMRNRSLRLALFSALGIELIFVSLGGHLFGESNEKFTQILSILLLGAVISAPGTIAGATLVSEGKGILRNISMMMGILISLSMFIILIPHFGLIGAALARSLGSIVASIVCSIFARNILRKLSALDSRINSPAICRSIKREQHIL